LSLVPACGDDGGGDGDGDGDGGNPIDAGGADAPPTSPTPTTRSPTN
jgi:hypothetical protein